MVPEAVAYAIKAARQLTSVASVLELTSIENESTDNTQWNTSIPNEWPQNGEIIASQLSFAFNPSENWTLQNLTFKINAGEKVGVVGCTGAGKSAIIGALLRMAELSNESRILIDGIDISCTPLRVLRSRISVVPRFPVIFSGKLRFNLDPRNKFNDNVLWDALEKVGLREAVQALEHGLQTESNSWNLVFSTHQRQLLCLARAIVIANKILILDVALVDINIDSELAMLNIIRTCFTDCTVLVISHRLRSVMRMDRVFVLKAGKLAEIGHPHELLGRKSSQFYNMVDQTGNIVKEQLINLSKEGFTCPQQMEQD